MALPVDIPFPNAHPRVGLLVRTTDADETPLRPDARFHPTAYGVLVYWPRQYASWLRVDGVADTGAAVTPLSGQAADLPAVINHHQANRLVMAQEVLADGWGHENAFLVGTVSAPAAIRLTFRVDTNHEEFVQFVADAAGDEKALGMTILYFDGSVDAADPQTVRLLLRPATPVPAAKVLLGVDLGNTTTTAAVLDPFARDGKGLAVPTQRIPMLTTRPVAGNRAVVVGVTDPNGTPIASEIRFDLFRTFAPAGTDVPANRRFPNLQDYTDDRPNAVDYVVGDLARAAGVPARRVVLGAKRMASVRPRRLPGRREPTYPAHAVIAPHQVVPDLPRPGEPLPEPKPAVMEVDARAPLELLACRVFQHFREARLAWPAKVALTYPTTYSRYELQALRRAVQQGWLRMQAVGQGSAYDATPPDPELAHLVRELQGVVRGRLDLDTQARDPVIQLLLDEASAAAFFHLYRRIFEQGDGGLNGFRYLHEHGLNMLLYDCGGGTTDIALVRAVVESDARTLRITVLRRTGVRTFGGDDITRQVCRLLKAKIAQVLAAERKVRTAEPPKVSAARPPADDKAWRALAADLERFITETAAADPLDELVRTRFDAGQTPVEERRAAALALWRLAEQLKHQLSADKAPPGLPPERFTPGVAQLPVWAWTRDTNALSRTVLAGTTEQQEVQLKRRLEAVTVTRTEVDALIYEPVMRSIANCNKLIRTVLEPADGPTGEVQWVVASGNAVRYPLLLRMLKERLAVAFLDDPKRFTFDPDNAKDATAKGAVLALAAMESQALQIDPKFDSDLADLLPFSVGYQDLTVDAVKVLYAEHTHYRALTDREPVEIPMPALTRTGVPPNRFVLMRQFPGDEGFHNFLAFEFPAGIQGGCLRVSYDDEDEYEFRVVDGSGEPGVPIDLTAGDTYVAPAQRGDI